MEKVLVIGDSCIDIFEYGKCYRISPEAPVPVLVPTTSIQNSGMTLNVCQNLFALGIDCDVITNDNKPIKKRYVEDISNHMLLRVDRNDSVDSLSWDKLYDIPFNEYKAVIISDYDKGFIDREQIRYISDAHPLTFMDCKKRLDEWCSNIKYIKINYKESQENWEFLHNGYKNNLIITNGKDGASLNYNKHFPMEIDDQHPVRDLSGAGDTFLAGLIAEFLNNNGNIDEAINFANKCAAWVVTQRGVAIVDKTKI
jgi:bifunctional ADP-heptose synthase (sugar kinase/adenylyltransferase)